MDTASSQSNFDNKVDDFSPIIADELSPSASEFFLVTNWIEKYSIDLKALKPMEEVLAENPFINDPLLLSLLPDEAVEEVKVPAPEPINFWTMPVRNKKERATGAQAKALPTASATVPGCFCPDCAPVAATTAPVVHSSPLSLQWLAPMGWAALFMVCSVSIISQLMALSASSSLQAKRLSDSGKYQEALIATSLAIQCNPLSSRPYFERARALTRMLRYREAEACLNKCLDINADDAQALDARAALSLKLDKPEQAISDTKRLLALSGARRTAFQYGNMAVAYYQIGQYDQAIKFYNKALALDNGGLSPRLGQAYCLWGKAQHKQALAACNRLLKEYPANSQVLALRGCCFERLHNLSAANKDFDLALAKEPNNFTYFGYHAEVMTALNKPSAALQDYIKAADLNHASARAQLVAAKMLKDLGRDKEALLYYDRLAQLPAFVRSFDQHQERAAINYNLGNYRACMEDLKSAIELEPDCNLHVREAICLARLGQGSDARAIIEEAYRLRPDSPTVKLGDAQVQAILGQTLSAVDKYSELLAKGDNREALVGRGQLYFDRQQWASAAQDLRKAVALGVRDGMVKADLAQCDHVLASGAKISIDLPKQKIVDLVKLSRVDLYNNGCKAYQEADMSLAVIYFAELAKREPTNVEARKNLARSYDGAGNHEGAIAVFEQLSQMGQLDVKEQACYAHALAANGLYDRSIAIMQRLNDGAPTNMAYRLELTKMLSASGQIDKAIGMCKDSLAMGASGEERKSLNNVYESLVTEKLRSKKGDQGSVRTNVSPVATEG